MTINLTNDELKFLLSKFNELSISGFESAQNYVAIGTILMGALQEKKPIKFSPELEKVFMLLLENIALKGLEVQIYSQILEKVKDEQQQQAKGKKV
jgi:hypothetical protein